MRFQFQDKKLELLYTTERGSHYYPPEVIDAFFEVMTVIAAAHDRRDLYALKGLRVEKLSGKRKDESSIRLNKQWRLTFRSLKDTQGNYLLIIAIEDYH